MTTKDELVDNIKAWMKVENELKVLQKEIKERRVMKKKLSENLVTIMRTNEIDCFDLNEGKLIYTKNSVKSALSKKHLEECLSQYFAQSTDVDAEEVSKYILEQRKIKVNESIRHKV